LNCGAVFEFVGMDEGEVAGIDALWAALLMLAPESGANAGAL
jgi:hypothetical protein